MADSEAAASLKLALSDLRTEGNELFALLRDMDTGYWTQQTSFKNWTVWDVVAHLHFSDHLALTTLSSADAFRHLRSDVMQAGSTQVYTNAWLRAEGHSLNGPELLDRWYGMFLQLCQALHNADPEERFQWIGPDMKARMFATARQMEIWAHGWEIYDLMGITRDHSDRLKNIVTLGMQTFAWSFINRKLPVPEERPYVRLTAPSGTVWTWGDAASEHHIAGSAAEFCQVVTQVRNIADTQLKLIGDNAVAWMAIAQCFAGPPEDPPAPGSRAR